MSWQPKCDHFSYTKDINDKTHHFCSIDGEPTEIYRSVECRRCPHNPDIIWPDGYIQFRHTAEADGWRTIWYVKNIDNHFEEPELWRPDYRNMEGDILK